MNHSIPLRILLAISLFSSAPLAFSKDQPYMEIAEEHLKEAIKPIPNDSKEVAPKPIDRAGLLKSAKAALQKAPALYKGHRAEAIEFTDVALEQLKAGMEEKAISSARKALGEVRDGIRTAR